MNSPQKILFKDAHDINGDDKFVVSIASGLSTKEELMAELRRKLKLPDYFGDNWDALSECLNDLSWVDQKKIVVVHGDVPRLEKNDLKKYLTVLDEAGANWGAPDPHILEIIFPVGSKEKVIAGLI